MAKKRRQPPGTAGKQCGAVKTDGSGDTCVLPAGFGTDHLGYGHCKFHFGKTPSQVIHAGRERAKDEAAKYGLPSEVEAETALMQELWRSQGAVLWLEDKVARLPEGDLKQRDMSGKFERPSVWVEMLWAERKHLATVARSIIDCRLGERAARVAEVQATAMVAACMAMLQDPDLGLTEDQIEKGKRVAALHLRALASGQ